MRTEEDLRAALTALERHAPREAAVVPTAPGRRPAARGPRSPRAVRALAGALTAVAAAGVIAALTLPGGRTTSGPDEGTAAPATATSPGTLRARLLAAISTASAGIVYERTTVTGPGMNKHMVTERWYTPWRASTGQLVRSRQLILNGDGTPYQDVADSYRMPVPGSVPAGLPAAVAGKLRAHRLAGAVAARGEIIDVEYGTRTWSDQKNHVLIDVDPGSPAVVTFDLLNARWTVAGRTRLEGRDAIELAWHDATGMTRLWVDAHSYLPLREEGSFAVAEPGGERYATSFRSDYRLLPATPANLAKLNPPIPSGFRETATQVLPPEQGLG